MDLQGEQGFYFIGLELSGFLRQRFQQLIGEQTATPQEVEVVMGRTLQVCSNFSIAGQNIIGVSMFSETILTLIIRFHWELMDVPILPLKNFAINLLEPQTILDYSVSHH